MSDEIKSNINSLLSEASFTNKKKFFKVEKTQETIFEEKKDILINYKYDDSAAVLGRKPIGFRTIGENVDPKNMTRKEYEHYLFYKYSFNVGKGWNGIETRPYRPNWSEDPSHNATNKEEACIFLGFKTINESPDGIEKRQKERRSANKDFRKNKIERRSKTRRSKDKNNQFLDLIIHIITFIVCILIYTFLWSLT